MYPAKKARLAAALLALLLHGPGMAASPTIWFAPSSPEPGWGGTIDYLDLFSPSAPWPNAASHVQVFKMYAMLVDYFSDDDMRRMFADLDRRGIALAVEFGPLTIEECGGGEGFGTTDGAHLASRLQQLGGKLRYIAMDEPFYHASTPWRDSTCQWSAQRVATNAQKQLALIRQVFPAVQVGDIEPFPDPDLLNVAEWQLRYRDWMDAWKAAAGAPLAFFHLDLNWTSLSLRNTIDVMRRYANERGVPLGIIYNGIGNEQSDAAWLNHAEQRLLDYETHGGSPPDHAIFQSWDLYPKHLLPETDPTTFTHLIDRYFRTRTQLSLSGSTTGVSGRLVDSANNPLAAAPVKVTATLLSGPGVISDYVVSGTVPTNAIMAIVGVR